MVRGVRGHLLVGLAAVALFAAAPAGAVGAEREPGRQPGSRGGARRARLARRSFPLPGWTVESTFTAVQYGTPGFPTARRCTALGRRGQLLRRRAGGATSAATQVVDVSGAAAEIDAGKVAATLSALLGGYSGQTDHAAVTATFLNAGGRAGRCGRPPHRHVRPTAT